MNEKLLFISVPGTQWSLVNGVWVEQKDEARIVFQLLTVNSFYREENDYDQDYKIYGPPPIERTIMTFNDGCEKEFLDVSLDRLTDALNRGLNQHTQMVIYVPREAAPRK